jgi:hypothetical protein
MCFAPSDPNLFSDKSKVFKLVIFSRDALRIANPLLPILFPPNSKVSKIGGTFDKNPAIVLDPSSPISLSIFF